MTYTFPSCLRIKALSGFLLFSFAAHAQTLNISAGTQMVNNGSMTLNNVNLVNEGTFLNAQPVSNVWFTGTAVQTISGSGTTSFYNLSLNKTGITKITFQQAATVAGAITMGFGHIDLGNSNLQLLPAAHVDNEAENSRITASGTGELVMTLPINAPSNLNPGNIGVKLNSTQNWGMTTIRRGHQVQTDAGGHQSIQRYYTIEPANNSNLNATVQLYYFDAELNNLTENGLAVYGKDGTADWLFMGKDATDLSLNFIQKDGVAAMSKFSLFAQAGTVLPLKLIAFNAVCKEPDVALQWVTSNEVNTKQFAIEKSGDGTGWQTVSVIQAQGNTVQHTYNILVGAAGASFFRLKMEDQNGQFTYSPVRKTDCGTNNRIVVGPNPTNGKVLITSGVPVNNPLLVDVTDANGRLILRKNWVAGTSSLPVDLSNQPSGMFLVTISGKDTNWTVKLIKK